MSLLHEVHVRPAVPGLREVGRQLDDVVEQLERQLDLLVRHGLDRAFHQQIDGGAAGMQPDALDGVGDRLGGLLVVGGGEKRVEIGKGLLSLGRRLRQGRAALRGRGPGPFAEARCAAAPGAGRRSAGPARGPASVVGRNRMRNHAGSIAGRECGGQRAAHAGQPPPAAHFGSAAQPWRALKRRLVLLMM